jgi:hypothetical protein
VSGAILLLGLGGYGVWQVSKPLSTKTVAYEKWFLRTWRAKIIEYLVR